MLGIKLRTLGRALDHWASSLGSLSRNVILFEYFLYNHMPMLHILPPLPAFWLLSESISLLVSHLRYFYYCLLHAVL